MYVWTYVCICNVSFQFKYYNGTNKLLLKNLLFTLVFHFILFYFIWPLIKNINKDFVLFFFSAPRPSLHHFVGLLVLKRVYFSINMSFFTETNVSAFKKGATTARKARRNRWEHVIKIQQLTRFKGHWVWEPFKALYSIKSNS